jgi:hypothetical protein
MTQTPIFKIVLVFVALIASMMRASALDYHAPTKCKTNSLDHVYYSVGETVLAYPYVANPIFLDPVEPDLLRDAPDPTDEVGCLGNPFQQGSLAFGSNSLRGYLHWSPHPVPEKFRAKADTWGELPNIDMLEIDCKRATIVETLPSGLKACRVKPENPPDAPVEDWAASYVADLAKYTTPMGRPFAVFCGPGLKSYSITRCEVAYSLRPDLGLSYEFRPYNGLAPVPVDQIINEDHKLREKFETWVVRDFKWPTPIKLPPE